MDDSPKVRMEDGAKIKLFCVATEVVSESIGASLV